jgi:ubiquinol-cytochrome c reductase subunit 8
MATFISKGFWNVCRRSKNQVLYFIPPLVLGYATMQWAIERWVAAGAAIVALSADQSRNEYLNSKQGRAEFADEE